MNFQTQGTPQSRLSTLRFVLTSLVLGLLAIAIFSVISLLYWLNTVQLYPHSLLVAGICPSGGIALIAISQAEIKMIKKRNAGETNKPLKIIYRTLTVLGIVAALIFMFLVNGYIVTTYLMN